MEQPDETAQGAGDAAVADPAERPASVAMPLGSELTADVATAITRAQPSRIIVLAGPVGSGKTSLLTAVYDLFGWGRFDHLEFAGSETLLGFERRCHTRRIASGRSSAETERTPLEPELKMLHLRVRDRATSATTDVLMTDISGERFRLAKDSTTECQKMTLLQSADRLVTCLDGERLTKRKTKVATITDGRLLLRSVLDAGMLSSSCVVQVVITKEDCLSAIEDETREELTRRIQEDFASRFAAKVGKLEFRSTSVKPLQYATGVTQLFSSWVESIPMLPPSKATAAPGVREYDRFRAL